MPALLPELLSDGLVLWRLRRSPEESFWCSVSDREGRLVLTIQSPSNTRLTMSESHTHIRSIIDRADRLQEQFCAAGWVEVDVDFDEPDLP